MRVLLFLKKGFEHIESSAFIDVLGWARHVFKHDIEVDTCGFTQIVESTFNIPVIVDKLITEINPGDYDALAIPGGFAAFGFYHKANNEELHQLVRHFDQNNKPIAAICVAALILGSSGILKGRKATTYHLEDGRHLERLKEYGAVVIQEKLVVDDKIITSCDPGTAPDVAFELLAQLTSHRDAAAVREAMGYL